MECNAEFVGNLARLDEKLCRLLTCDAEFALKRNAAILGRYSDAHKQLKILGAARLLYNLLQFVFAIERKALYVIVEVCFADGMARLDRVHEVEPDARYRRRIFELGN